MKYLAYIISIVAENNDINELIRSILTQLKRKMKHSY